MKKIFTLTIMFIVAFTLSKAQTFSDDFEGYTAGSKLGPQSPNWTTWSGTDGSNEDVNVVTTDAHSGTQSIYFSSTSSTGGPQDVVLPFGGVYNTGQFKFEASLKVPSTKTAYFNFQANAVIGQVWAMDFNMNADGTFNIGNTGGPLLSGTYPQGAWFELVIDINLNTNNWEVYIDSTFQGNFSNTVNQVASMDIYPSNNQASFWIDDVSYTVTPYILPARNGAVNILNVSNGLVGQQRNPSVTVRNLGSSTITSFDIMIDNGGTPVTQSVSSISLASLATTVVNISTSYTLAAGNNTYTAVIKNVNGIAGDDDPSDDTLSKTIVPIEPAANKKVVVEEGTGTWCQWCPRGAVFMEMMNDKYAGYFVGVAVHNADPMVYGPYDTGLGSLINGYPSVLVNRGNDIDPSAMEPDFLERIVEVPEGTIMNGATFDAGTRELKVSLTTTFQANVTGNYKVACVLTEDDVTGTTSGYAQVNAYAGGGSGVMGGYELLPSVVPANQMVYDHVARVISPSFQGLSNAYGGTNTIGQQITHTFTYILPSGWDEDEIHIVGFFIDPSGNIDNASSTTIVEAVANGYTPGTEVGVAEIKNEFKFNLSPNPATDKAILTMELNEPADVKLEVYQVTGALVASKAYGELSGNVSLLIETSILDAGMYFVNVIVDGKKSVLKLVKQ